MAELALSVAEFNRLYRGTGGYRALPRQSTWVTLADVFTNAVAESLCPRHAPASIPSAVDPAVEDLASQFFTEFADMEQRHAAQMRWIFAYSYADPNFLEAVRRYPLVEDAFQAQGLRASRLWADGDYMAQSLMLLEGIPAEYAYMVHPRQEPDLRYP